MNEVLIQMLQFIMAFVGVILLFFFVINFLTKGFVLKYLIVKASQGRKLLVEISSATDDYFAIGRWEDGFLKFKNRGKEEKAIEMNSSVFRQMITRIMGISKLNVDELGNTFLKKDFEAVKFEVDSGRLNTTLIRIKNRPVPKSKQEQLIIIMLGLLIIGIIILFLRLNTLAEAITNITSLAGVV